MQVRREDKYHGLTQTVLTVWKVSVSLFFFVFISETTVTQGTRHVWFLRWCFPPPLSQDTVLGCWVGGVRISLGIRTDKEPIKVQYLLVHP